MRGNISEAFKAAVDVAVGAVAIGKVVVGEEDVGEAALGEAPRAGVAGREVGFPIASDGANSMVPLGMSTGSDINATLDTSFKQFSRWHLRKSKTYIQYPQIG
jgi:hypothetical protein